ncbi:hypothetical protein EMEDMD4_300046 [Sinorhizobium medicae]|uniref:Uncharacterized protein n=1 Tax=Sinorhizobium medicae TaxID=110321 RepID=A0A508WXZ8_9HYPH|nr:hypothetical protein EMEDMD4_300046 [Sinorhizobium medicae]
MRSGGIRSIPEGFERNACMGAPRRGAERLGVQGTSWRTRPPQLFCLPSMTPLARSEALRLILTTRKAKWLMLSKDGGEGGAFPTESNTCLTIEEEKDVCGLPPA